MKKKIWDVFVVISLILVVLTLVLNVIAGIRNADFTKSVAYVFGYLSVDFLPLIAGIYLVIWVVLKIKENKKK